MSYVTSIDEHVVRIVACVLDPSDVDVSEREVRLTSNGQRLTIAMPVMVYPNHPLNSCKFHRRTEKLVLSLRRPFASSTWEMFEHCDRQFALMQAEASRLFGSEVSNGVHITGAMKDQNCLQIHVEEGKGVHVNLQAEGVDERSLPHVRLGDKDELYLPWADHVVTDSDSSSDSSTSRADDTSDKVRNKRVAARIAQESLKVGLRVGHPEALRADGRIVKGQSVFTTRVRLAGEVVAYYRGRILPRGKMLHQRRARRFYFYLDDNHTIDGGTGGAKPHAAHVTSYINSPTGCVAKDGLPLQANLKPIVDPSLGLGRKSLRFRVERDIAAGEELFYSYGDEHDLSNLSPESSSDDSIHYELKQLQNEQVSRARQ